MSDAPGVIFGEVLFDRFPDGREVLGGAPFNVAWNLHHLGEPVLFVGAVGRDAPGERVREAMRAGGLTDSALYAHPERPTGAVEVTVEAGEPTYRILPDQAYDDLPPNVPDSVPAAIPLLYHGTLALRSGNRHLQAGLQARAERRFVDANLRLPWYDVADVHALLHGAEVVKLNADELAELAPDVAPEERAAALLETCAIGEALIVTLGADGARIHPRGQAPVEAAAPPVAALQDAVGAGDAFASVAILGLRHGWSWPVILERALDYAARVCTLQGATTGDTEFYRAAVTAWQSPRD